MSGVWMGVWEPRGQYCSWVFMHAAGLGQVIELVLPAVPPGPPEEPEDEDELRRSTAPAQEKRGNGEQNSDPAATSGIEEQLA